MENSFHFFPLWKRGVKGDLMAFQKAKLLLKILFISPRNVNPTNHSAQNFIPGKLREAVLPPSTGRAWPVI